MWRLVLDRVATLTEIETAWDIVDVLDANEAADLKADAEAAVATSPVDQPGGQG